MKVITRATLALLLVVPVLLLGCQSDGVEFDEGEMLTFEGTIEELTQIDTYDFTIINQGTVRIELTELDTRIGDTGEPIEPQGIGVAFGRPNAEGTCLPTVSVPMQAIWVPGLIQSFIKSGSWAEVMVMMTSA